MISSVLVVCVGNICRSPVGERMIAAACPNLRVESAGIAALVGHDADKTFGKVAHANNVDLGGHTARQFTSKLAADFDLILGLEKGHLKVISEQAPEASGKAMLLGQWVGQADIADPYKKSAEMQVLVFDQLRDAADGWIAKLKETK